MCITGRGIDIIENERLSEYKQLLEQRKCCKALCTLSSPSSKENVSHLACMISRWDAVGVGIQTYIYLNVLGLYMAHESVSFVKSTGERYVMP